MYYRLFNQITDVINELKKIQMEAEEIFLSQESEKKILKILDQKKEDR
jgi:hypothetical protein